MWAVKNVDWFKCINFYCENGEEHKCSGVYGDEWKGSVCEIRLRRKKKECQNFNNARKLFLKDGEKRKRNSSNLREVQKKRRNVK